MRKQLMAIAAGAILGAASLSTAALAAHGGGGGGHGGGGGGHASFGGGGGGHPSFGGGHPSFGGGQPGFAARSFAAPNAGVNNFAAARGNFSVNHTVLPNAAIGGRGNFAANGHPGHWSHGHWFPGYAIGGAYALGGYGSYYDYDPGYYGYSDGSDGCLQQMAVQTVYGPQLQWVDVCQ